MVEPLRLHGDANRKVRAALLLTTVLVAAPLAVERASAQVINFGASTTDTTDRVSTAPTVLQFNATAAGITVNLNGSVSGNGPVTYTAATGTTLVNVNSTTNSNSGATTVTGLGTVTFAGAGSISSTSDFVINGGNTLTVNLNGATHTVASFTQQAGGQASNFTGLSNGTLITNGAISFQAGNIAPNLTLQGSGAVTKSTAGTVTMRGVLATTGGLTVNAGTLRLFNTNTYTGGTIINGGTLGVLAAGALGNASNLLTINGGILDVFGTTQTIGGLLMTGGTIQTSVAGAGALVSATDYDLQAGTINIALNGNVGLNKSTAGTVTLGSANGYTGNTNVSGGTLNLQAAGALGSGAGVLTVSGGSTVALNGFNQSVGGVSLVNGTISGTGGILTSSGTIDLQSGTVSAGLAGAGAITKTTAGVVTVSGVIGTSGGLTVQAGTLNLTAANTYTGNTAVTGGTLALSGAGTMGAVSNTLSISGGGVVDLGTTNQTVAGVTLTNGTISGTGTLTSTGAIGLQQGSISTALAGAGAITKSTAGAVTLSGAIGTTGGLTVQAGTLTLSAANSYTGGTTITGGTLLLSGAGTLGSTANTLSMSGASILNMGGTSQTVAGLSMNGGTIFNGGTLTSNGAIDLQAGSILVNLAGSGTITKSTAGSALISGVVSTTGGLVVQGGTIDLSGANTYTGNTVVTGGLLTLTGAGTLGATSNTLSISGTGTVGLNNTNQTVSAFTLAGTGSLLGPGTLTSNGAISLQGGTLAATLAGSGAVTKSTAGTVTATGAINTTGGLTVQAGTLNLQAANGYTGFTNITGGTLALSGAGTLGAVTNTLAISGGGILDLGSTNQTVSTFTLTNGQVNGTGTLTATGAVDLQQGSIAANLTANSTITKTTAGTVTITGALNGANGLDVQGGILDLQGVSTFTGGTFNIASGAAALLGANFTIAGTATNSGTLAFSASGVTLDTTGLTNTGTIQAFRTSGSGAFLSTINGPFANSGLVTLSNNSANDSLVVNGNLTAGGGSRFALDFNPGANAADTVVINGTVTGNSTLQLNRVGPSNLLSAPLLVVTTGGGTGNFSASGLNSSNAFINYALQRSGNNYQIVSNVNPAANIAGASINAALSAISSGFFEPTSAFITSSRSRQGSTQQGIGDSLTDQMSLGFWARTKVGQYTVSNTTTLDSGPGGGGVQKADARFRANFTGIQAGLDAGFSDIGGSGISAFTGLTAGQVNVSGSDLASKTSSRVSFDAPFVGVYGAVIGYGSYADLQILRNYYNMKLTNAALNLRDKKANADGWSAYGSAATTVQIYENVILQPSLGLIYANTALTPIKAADGTIRSKDVDSWLGRVGAKLATSFAASETLVLRPEVSYNLWHEFAGPVKGSIALPGQSFNPTTSTTRVGTFNQIGAALNAQFTDTGLFAFVRGEYRWGENIHGAALTAGMRYSF
ncbi:beta strand repeat-containing protein [Prosthecomicrobium sp. N25]|uniref:beta strand repeat-containing protein n=1 Tax=Prosthecomicrobium sp. N25 TaxID=3129254 RepID=UPI00307781B1